MITRSKVFMARQAFFVLFWKDKALPGKPGAVAVFEAKLSVFTKKSVGLRL